MSGNNQNGAKHGGSGLSVDQGRAAKRTRESFHFPGRNQNGAANVYRKLLGYRDNSSYLEELFNNENNAICFTRPRQLGKTTLFWLADELFSINKTSKVDTDLSYFPGEGDKNNWHVLRIDFGAVCIGSYQTNEGDEEWVRTCEGLDNDTKIIIKQKVLVLLMQNKQLEESFHRVSLGKEIKHLQIGTLISSLASAVHLLQGRLLILVDEYDQPVREGLVQLIPHHSHSLYESVEDQIKSCFRHYFGFFRAVKVVLEQLPHAKIWLTGVTPIAIDEMSGLNVVHLTFQKEMADAVGITENDVQRMLDHVHNCAPFRDGERGRALHLLKRNFNNLRFPGSQPLYHTALVNSVMNRMLDNSSARREFLRDEVPKSLAREPVPSSIFNVLCNARNLRVVAKKLAEGGKVTGYKINQRLSLEHLLKETIDVGDYLTLLLHIGVVSAVGTPVNPVFTITSEFYCKDLLEPLLRTLRLSLETLLALESTKDLYEQGENILVDFVTSISKNTMAGLMAWASSDHKNHTLELQFQSYVVTEAHEILNGIARTSQEDKLPETGKRTDVTFSSTSSVVILDLKQVESTTAPAAAYLSKAHEQLAGYVGTKRAMESVGRGRPVAGFIIVMYDDGDAYVVEKLRSDSIQ